MGVDIKTEEFSEEFMENNFSVTEHELKEQERSNVSFQILRLIASLSNFST